MGDLNGLKLSDEIQFDKIPVTVMVKSKLSKTRHQYSSFIGEEGATYIKKYLEERRKQGEELSYDSPLLQFDPRGIKKNAFLRTTLVTRDVRDAIYGAGLKMSPYVLRAYFSNALDIAESKDLISHPWRQFIMGHKGDIETRYSTNKRLPPDMIEEMRESYKKCLKYLETRITEPSESDAKIYLQQQLLLAVGYKQEEIDRMNLTEMDNEAFQKLLRDKVAGAMSGNGSKQRLVSADEMKEILQMRAEEGLYKYSSEAISLLSAMLVRDYRSDARIGIKALEILGRNNKWDDEEVRNALKQAYIEVEGETLRNLGDRDLLILASLTRNQDTNKAYAEVSSNDNIFLKGMSKSTFFQSVNYLQNLGLITLIKKKIGRYYTMESQILLSDESIVSVELRKRL